jgi:hypothetical protein
MKVQNTLTYQNQRISPPEKTRSASMKTKACTAVAVGLVLVAAIYAMTGQTSVPVRPIVKPVAKCDPGNIACEVAKKFFSNLEGTLKTTLGTADDNVRRTVYESCTALFSNYNFGDLDECYNRKKLFHPEPVWSFLLLQDIKSLRIQLEKMCESVSYCESNIPESIDNMFAYLLNLRWNDQSIPMEGPGVDVFSFCNAQIGKENLYEAASSVAKAKIGSTDFYDRKLALMLFRSLFKEGQGYKAADEAIEAHSKNTDPNVEKSVLALSKMLPSRFLRLFV